MIDHLYILNDKDEPVHVTDVLEWSHWFEQSTKNGQRTVVHDEFGPIQVSTIFLGLNYQYLEGPPLLYETMIFNGKYDGYQTRCSTRDEALEMHQVAVTLVRKANQV